MGLGVRDSLRTEFVCVDLVYETEELPLTRNANTCTTLKAIKPCMSYSLNSLKGGYIGDYIGDYYRGY